MSRASSLHAIRRFCLDCMGGSQELVRSCPDFACKLHDFRLPLPPEDMGRPIRAIRRHCMDCAGSSGDIRRCPARPGKAEEGGDCPLWRYRLGISDRGLAKLAKRIEKARSLKLPGLG